jgi:hypothetical protein
MSITPSGKLEPMMADPITPAVVAASQQAVAAGVAASILTHLHIDPWLLFASFFGAILGLTSAPKSDSGWRDAILFCAVVFGSSWLGASLAPWVRAQLPSFQSPEGPATFFVAAFFHPTFNWFAAALPSFLSSRFTLGTVAKETQK